MSAGRVCEDKKHEDNLIMVFQEKGEVFFEVESVINKRVRKGLVEYLIKWKGSPRSQSSWEPCQNLCDSAMEEARKFELKRKKKTQKSRGRPSHSVSREIVSACIKDTNDGIKTKAMEYGRIEVGGVSGASSQQRSNSSEIKPAPPPPPHPLENDCWRWTDDEQLNYQGVERIDVNNLDSKRRITEARLNGTPIVLTGHVGWANFAKKWLTPREVKEKVGLTDEDKWLDLSSNYKLDVNRMITDIGDEVVPLLKKNYDETNPLQASMKASNFLKTYWPDENGKYFSNDSLYLHQWQFPLSESAGKKLCHQNNPLPNNILGEDLLKYWLDLSQCKHDSPLQYIFMGRDDTMSKLHCDNGGLEISIAPIVGQKECVLVHRLDGESCLYELDASIDDVDLQKYPLMANARIWKTCIKPGEILLMPQGTYHQCRNATPCLSYSRFHLDTINLLPFLQSMIDQDADEIDHGEVIWNSSTELVNILDEFVDNCKSCRESTPPKPAPTVSTDIIQKVNTLRSLRNICQEIKRRLSTHKKGHKRRRKRDKAGDSYANSEVGMGGKCYALENWVCLVEEIDDSLHHFRHRNLTRPPVRARNIMKSEILMHANKGKNNKRNSQNQLCPRKSDSAKRQRRNHTNFCAGYMVEQYEEIKGEETSNRNVRSVRPIRVLKRHELDTEVAGANKNLILYSMSKLQELFTKRESLSVNEENSCKVEQLQFLEQNFCQVSEEEWSKFIFENGICKNIDETTETKKNMISPEKPSNNHQPREYNSIDAAMNSKKDVVSSEESFKDHQPKERNYNDVTMEIKKGVAPMEGLFKDYQLKECNRIGAMMKTKKNAASPKISFKECNDNNITMGMKIDATSTKTTFKNHQPKESDNIDVVIENKKDKFSPEEPFKDHQPEECKNNNVTMEMEKKMVHLKGTSKYTEFLENLPLSKTSKIGDNNPISKGKDVNIYQNDTDLITSSLTENEVSESLLSNDSKTNGTHSFVVVKDGRVKRQNPSIGYQESMKNYLVEFPSDNVISEEVHQ